MEGLRFAVALDGLGSSHVKKKKPQDYKLLLKFHFEIIIQCDYPVYLTNPWWHFRPYETVPGYLNCKDPVELNFFVPIKKDLKVLINGISSINILI